MIVATQELTAASETRLPSPAQPSSLYRTEFWRLGLFCARVLPYGGAVELARMLAFIYRRMNRRRREVVIENVRPVLQGDQARAQQITRELFQQFAVKLVDLWRYESGIGIGDLFQEV